MPEGMLLRGVARTAVAAGTATAVRNRVTMRQAERWQEQGRLASPAEQAPAAAVPQAQEGAGGTSTIDQLKELAQLKDQGVLTEEEFESQKARVLAES